MNPDGSAMRCVLSLRWPVSVGNNEGSRLFAHLQIFLGRTSGKTITTRSSNKELMPLSSEPFRRTSGNTGDSHLLSPSPIAIAAAFHNPTATEPLVVPEDPALNRLDAFQSQMLMLKDTPVL